MKDNDVKEMKDFINSRKGKSENDILEEIGSVADKTKKDGSFDYGKIEKFSKQLQPFLNQTQKKRLEEVMRALKGKNEN